MKNKTGTFQCVFLMLTVAKSSGFNATCTLRWPKALAMVQTGPDLVRSILSLYYGSSGIQ